MTFVLGGPGATTPYTVSMAAQGLITQNFDRSSAANSSIPTSGNVIYALVGLLAGSVVRAICLGVDGAAAGMTGAKVGLATLAGARLGISVDLGASWETVGMKTHALITPYIVPTSGGYYLAFWGTSSSNMPSLTRGANANGSARALTGGYARPLAQMAGQTDIPAVGVLSDGPGAGYWMGVGI